MDFRQYDAGLGRFYGLDLLAESTPWATPNHFALNNPVIASDPTGLRTRYSDDEPMMMSPDPNDGSGSGGGGFINLFNGGNPRDNLANFDASGGMGMGWGNGTGNSYINGGAGGINPGRTGHIDGQGGHWERFTPSNTLSSKERQLLQQLLQSEAPNARQLDEVPIGSRWVADEKASSSGWAEGTLSFIAADIMILEPTDAAWPKWAGYAIAGGIAAAYLYSGDYVEKMNREIEGIKERALGPPGFAYELVATKNGQYPNLNTGGTTYLKVGEVWKFGETTQGFGRYPDKKIDLVRDNLSMIPLPPGGNQMQIKIQEKYLIYGYFFSNGHRPPGNPIFR